MEVSVATAPSVENRGSDAAAPAGSVGGRIAPLSYLPQWSSSNDIIAGVLLKDWAAQAQAVAVLLVRPLLATLRSSLDETEHELSTTLDALAVAAQSEADASRRRSRRSASAARARTPSRRVDLSSRRPGFTSSRRRRCSTARSTTR